MEEPLLGSSLGSGGSAKITRKSEHPLLSLISSSPRPRQFPDPSSSLSLFLNDERGRRTEKFYVPPLKSPGSVRREPSSRLAESLKGPSVLTPGETSGQESLFRIPEHPCCQCSSSRAHVEDRDLDATWSPRDRRRNSSEGDLEALLSPRQERRDYSEVPDDSNTGIFGESLTDDAEESQVEKESWKRSGVTGLLLSALPEVLNPFSYTGEDDHYDRHEPHECNSNEQNGESVWKTSGVTGFLYSALPTLAEVLSPFPSREEDQCDRDEQHESKSNEHDEDSVWNTGLLFNSMPSLPVLANQSSFPPDEDLLDHAEAASASGLPKHDSEMPSELSADGPNVAQSSAKWKRKTLHRCRTAPMLTGMGNGLAKLGSEPASTKNRNRNRNRNQTASSVVYQAFAGLCVYLLAGVVIYTWKREEFSGIETVGVVDALYFCIVTMCTIGYGDITPITPSAKILACALVLVGFGFVDALMSGMVTFVLDRQEHLLLTVVEDGNHERARNYVMDTKKGRMRIRMKAALAIGTVLSSVLVGVIVLHHMEDLTWIDALYVTCISITTVGFGDYSFQTLWGRLFAAVWLLLSTLGVARAFLFLAEARVHRRHRHFTRKILQKRMTSNDLMSMDLDNDGHVSKSEFVVFKLQEMGKINKGEIGEICKQFDFLDSMNAGKITLGLLLESEQENR